MSHIKRLITRDEWKLICQIRQAEICQKKVHYFHETNAIAEAIYQSSKRPQGSLPFRTYKCPICTHGHLTSKPLLKPAEKTDYAKLAEERIAKISR